MKTDTKMAARTEKKHISRRFRHYLRANEAVAAMEYALLVGLVAVAVGAAVVTFSDDVQNAIVGIGDEVAKVGVGTLTPSTPDTTAN